MKNIHWSWFWNKYKFNKEFSIGRCSLKKIGLCMYTYYYIYTFLYGRVFFQTESFIFGECNKSHVQQRRKLWNYKSDSAVYLYHFDSWAQVFFSWAKLVNHLDIILRNLSPIDCDYSINAGINASLVTIVKESHLVLKDPKYILSDVSIWLALRKVEQWLSSIYVKFLIVYLHFKTWQNLQIIPKKAWKEALFNLPSIFMVDFR